MRITFIDRNPAVIKALADAFEGVDAAKAVHGDIFADDKTPADFDALISPANSFGYMDGGIDRVYLDHYGWELQTEVQTSIKQFTNFGELLVGDAMVVPINSTTDLICAPTMRLPGPIPSVNVYMAMRAAIFVARAHNFQHVVCPGLGTATGRVDPADAATAMLYGYQTAMEKRTWQNLCSS